MEIKNNVEKYTRRIAKILLIAGVIVGVLSTLIAIDYLSENSPQSIIKGMPLFSMGVGIVISSIVIWAVLNVLVNISLKLDRNK